VGERYGQPQRSGFSPTHEEYLEARERVPVLVFVQNGVTREPAQNQFLDQVQAWESGHYRAGFSTPDDVRDVVSKALYDLGLALERGAANEQEILGRARALLPNQVRQATPAICVVVAGGPPQTVIRPAQIGDEKLADQVLRAALLGPTPVFTTSEGSSHALENDALVLSQDNASILINGQGSIRIVQAARTQVRGWPSAGVPSIIQEDVQERIERALRFAAGVLDQVDPVRRLSAVVPIAALLGAGFMPWRTRAEHAANPNSARMSLGGHDTVLAELAPASRTRAALSQDAGAIAEDLTALLGRRMLRR
jgi:hypothetical protein